MQIANMNLTKHARDRANHRAVKHAMIERLLCWSDIEVPVGKGLFVLRLSRQAMALAKAEGISANEIESLARLAIVASDDGAIVTVVKIHGKAARRYSRRRDAYWKGGGK